MTVSDSLNNMQAQMAELSALIEETQAEIEALGDADAANEQAELTRLQTALVGYRNSYADLLRSYEEMRLTAVQSADDIVLYTKAEVPGSPIRPRPVTNTALAGAVGAMLAVGVAFLVEYLDDTIKDPDDVTRNMKRFEAEVRYLHDNGAPISGLGFQSRFARKIPPETLYKRLQYFEKFNLPIAATEFEMKNTLGSEQARAAMTEHAMTVLFSHKLVNAIYAWTILASGSDADRAIVNSDGTLNLRGKVWMYLMKNRWWTDESLTTDANGMVKLRGFKGDYAVTFGNDDATGSMELHLNQDRC